MDIINQIITVLLPFNWADHQFMRNALIAVILITPMFGLLGTLVVNNKMAFFSDSIGHSTFTGIAIGVMIGLQNPIYAMIGFAVVFALGITIIKYQTAGSSDTIIGVFSSSTVALGVMLLSKGGSFAKYTSYLIGDILSIRQNELLIIFIILILVIIFWLFFFNKLLFTGINVNLAASRRIKVLLLESLFTILLAVIVALSIQWIGLLIINSLLILPAAASANISIKVRDYHIFSVIFALFSGISGLITSYYLSTATGATIVMFAALLYFITVLIKR